MISPNYQTKIHYILCIKYKKEYVKFSIAILTRYDVFL